MLPGGTGAQAGRLQPLHGPPTLKRLAAYHLVYAPDLPGFGESVKPRRVLDVTGLSDSLAAWMRKIGLERAVLVGNYFGYQIIAD